MVDLRQTEKYVEYMRSIGWTVERIDGVNYFIRSIPLLGSFMKVQRPEEIRYKDIKILSEKYRTFQIILEPKDLNHKSLIINHGYKVSSPYLPSKTIHIDLTKSEHQLLKEMHPKTRYNIKQALKKGVKIKESEDIRVFAQLWKNVKFSRKMMGTKDLTELHKAFGKDAHLLLTYHNDELLAGVLNIHSADISYYMYAATSAVGKKLYAPTLVTWESIKLAKQKGLKLYDFEGIYDERFPLRSWKGFSRFKKGFGGKEVIYPGAYAKNKPAV